ncbi:hypothetical protein [Krasilnikovia sp. MM14-A1259]|uniref:hypothetical protein n=1 Tax=Krasilnikovia sp. MM14-A1259 TaxID=3373539 RepID=UPI00380C9EA6
MITVDHPTERRNAGLQYVIVAFALSVLLYLAVDDKRVFAALLVPLLQVALYRSWNVERLSPSLAQHYGHTVVAHGADRMAREFATDSWLHDSWASRGAPLARLLALQPGQITSKMEVLDAAGPPRRTMSAAGRAVNRTAAALLGLTLGWVVGWGWFALPWPILAGLVMLVAWRAVLAAYNRWQLGRLTATIRTNTRAELEALLAPPWAGRLMAVSRELDRLLAPSAGARRVPELRVIELLLAGGIVLGAVVGWAGV